MDTITFEQLFTNYREKTLQGRYISYLDLQPLLSDLSPLFTKEILGHSENGIPIPMLTIGTGPKKLLFWSQMHGNESTTTKALFDLFNLLGDSKNSFAVPVLESCTLYFIPMLNPDGSKAYTRVNFNKVDLNRDAQNLSQVESRIFRKVLDTVKPHVAFNLHGQRTIFSAGVANKPATISFLSPAGDPERTITKDRKIAMEIIAVMNAMLQTVIPGQVGRYDDSFNLNCTGDTLANQGIPTILFEAGHFPNDYSRDIVRKFIFYSLLSSIQYSSTTALSGEGHLRYFDIPENDKLFFDHIIRDVVLNEEHVDIAIQFTEQLQLKQVIFVPIITKIGDLSTFYGHKEITGSGRVIKCYNDTVGLVEGIELSRYLLDNELFSV